jgi:Glycosyl hydrolases family 43
MARRRWLATAGLVAVVASLAAATWVDVRANLRSDHEQTSLADARHHLATLRHDVAVTNFANAVTTGRQHQLESSIATSLSQLATANSVLTSTNAYALAQGAGITTLQQCLAGVSSAYGQIARNNNTQAAQDISAVSGPCTALEGGTGSGLVYPFDFPDPDVIAVGKTFFGYATNSVGGSIQIIESNDLTHWAVVGDALSSLPGWAAPNATWAPAVAQFGGNFLLYYTAKVAGTGQECISVATAHQPEGPFVDSSTAPMECQTALGGSIDPSPFVDTNGTPYLEWKSGGPGDSRLWSQQLDPAGTGFAFASKPYEMLVPDQPWQGGTVEAPDLITAGGRYFLFYSGNDWNSASYAVGVATCTGPVGPCVDASPQPILASGDGVAGPGGESVFADGSGSYWIAFHAWVPGSVGFPNSRCLYLRHLDLSGPLPSVGGPV